MDPQRMKEAYERLRLLDERFSHKIRPSRRALALHSPSIEELEERLRDVATYSVELRSIVEELFVALADKRPPPRPESPA